MAEARIARFRYNVALYLSYLQIKSDDEIKGVPLNFKHNFWSAGVQSQTDV